jgi:transcriptional regulator with XRE-family HTH domain
MASRAHEELRKRYEQREFSVKALAQRVGCTVGAIRFILSGTVPKVTIATAIEKELGIPVVDWTTPSEVIAQGQRLVEVGTR